MKKEIVFKKIGLKIRELRGSKDISIVMLADKLDIEYKDGIVRGRYARLNKRILEGLKIYHIRRE